MTKFFLQDAAEYQSMEFGQYKGMFSRADDDRINEEIADHVSELAKMLLQDKIATHHVRRCVRRLLMAIEEVEFRLARDIVANPKYRNRKSKVIPYNYPDVLSYADSIVNRQAVGRTDYAPNCEAFE